MLRSSLPSQGPLVLWSSGSSLIGHILGVYRDNGKENGIYYMILLRCMSKVPTVLRIRWVPVAVLVTVRVFWGSSYV